MTNWNDKDLKFLTENIDKFTVKELAKKLGRSYSSVNNKLASLGLKTDKSVKKETKTKEKTIYPEKSKPTEKPLIESVEVSPDELKQVGTNAGVIWRYFNANPNQTVVEALKGTNLSLKDFYLSFGWLAKENKIVVNEEGKFSVR